MKVHLIRKETIETFVLEYAQCRIALNEWLFKIKNADWEKTADIQATFRTADLLGKSSNRVVFDIAGKHYRMICKYAFGDKQVHLFGCWIGTHAAYDKLCNGQEQFTVSVH